jgi:hypothetical protein
MQDELIDIYGDYEILMEDDELSGSELAFMVDMMLRLKRPKVLF